MWFATARLSWRCSTVITRIALCSLFLSLMLNAFGPVGPASAAPNGGILVWGANQDDQLGLAATGAQRATPGAVNASTSTGVAAIAAGSSFTLVLRDDGSVLSFGSNFPSGQLGQGSTADRLDPGAVQGLSGATAITAGRDHGLAIAGGNVYGWGSNYYGQLGTATAENCNSGTCSRTAILVPGLGGAKALGTGNNHSLVVLADGSIYSFGLNLGGALGDGSNVAQRTTPVAVKGLGGSGTLTSVKAVAGGYEHSLALLDNGTVAAWGTNNKGQLGLGASDTASHSTPALVPGLSNIVAIAAGHSFSMALRADGAIFTWGNNSEGQLGTGTASDSGCSCVGAPFHVASLPAAKAIGAGQAHGLAVLADGTVRTWGLNNNEQITAGSVKVIATPAVVPGVAHATAADGGYGHSVVVQEAPQVALSVGTNGTGSGAVVPGSASYPEGAQVTLTATAAPGSVFVGWTVNGQTGGWGNPLTLTLNANTSVVATFNTPPAFCDVSPNDPYLNAIQQLSARGIIRGFEREDGQLCFAPAEGTKRAQMAALIARPLGWDLEDHGNGFSDRGTVDDNLWRNVGTLAHYDVARGYKPETCAALGVPAPCYGPADEVVYAQVVSFITRGMVAKGYWQYQPDSGVYPNVGADSGHRVDIATYVHYAGSLPGADNTAGSWNSFDQPATRGWFAEAEWRALNSYFTLAR
jgi:alpha-tubulin suppressor-like RCC1 family protein